MITNLLFNLFIAHIVGDFYLQGASSCQNKILHAAKGKDLWLHALIIGALSWVATFDMRGWWLALGIMVLHFLTDWLKSWVQLKWNIVCIEETKGGKLVDGVNKRFDLRVFLADQLVHLAVILVFAQWWIAKNSDWCQLAFLQDLYVQHPLRVKTTVAMLLALKPANILILLILGACKVRIIQSESEDHGNFHSGELIGWLERGLMLLFVVMSQYEAIGFLIAAKSILRFSEASSGSEKSEYVLTGTLLSLSTALALGIAVTRFI